jgi:hypothetical protein
MALSELLLSGGTSLWYRKGNKACLNLSIALKNAQNMLNLRTANLSGKWHKVIAIIRGNKANAA